MRESFSKTGLKLFVAALLALLSAAAGALLYMSSDGLRLILAAHPLMTAFLLVAAVLALSAVSGRAIVARAAARVSRSIDQLAGGETPSGDPGVPSWLGGVRESCERLARAMDERTARDIARCEETSTLRQKSEGLEARLINANADLSSKEAMLSRANTELINANRAKGDFISRMGRELRLPLNTIIGMADYLVEDRAGPLSDKQREYLDKIRTRALTLLDVENNIIEYSMLDSAGPPVLSDITASEAAAAAVASLSQYAKSMNVSIGMDVPPARLKADPDKLRYILYALMQNAIKFNIPGGMVSISARTVQAGVPADTAGDGIEFMVEDSGIGICPSRYGELFRPFSQIADETGSKPGGAGLSLFMVRRYVEMHGGRVWVDASPSGGCVFHALIPGAARATDVPGAVARKKKVLIVEDDPDQMKLVSAFLAASPYELVKACDGMEALKALEEITPDIILMDVMMPRMGGIEVCRAVKRQDKFKGLHRVPVVMMTSLTDMENKLDAIKAGADDVIHKPIDRRLLVERIKYLLEAKEELEDVMASYKDLEKEALVDPLTGLFNRRHMDEVVAREFVNSRRFGRSLSVLMLDLDHFKAYNDMFGHPAGDELLRNAATIFVDSVREVDLVARYGGEEFVVILPETPAELALVAAERIRKSVEARTPVTISIGQASFPDDAGELSELMVRADSALYRAKQAGRNRTVCYRDCADDDGPADGPAPE